MNYYPHHIGDYLRDTVHLSLVEDAIYRRMLDIYYSSEKPLPLDFDYLCKMVRATKTEERELTSWVLGQFFQKCDDGWRNKRADEELRRGRTRAKAARLNGKKGGRPKTQRVSKKNPAGSHDANPQLSSQNQSQRLKEAASEPVGSLDPIWGPGLTILLQAGVPESHARAFIGALLGSWSEADVLEAIQASAGKADVRGYVRGVLRSKPKKGEAAVRRVAL